MKVFDVVLIVSEGPGSGCRPERRKDLVLLVVLSPSEDLVLLVVLNAVKDLVPGP